MSEEQQPELKLVVKLFSPIRAGEDVVIAVVLSTVLLAALNLLADSPVSWVVVFAPVWATCLVGVMVLILAVLVALIGTEENE
jgi:hypothetical protein